MHLSFNKTYRITHRSCFKNIFRHARKHYFTNIAFLLLDRNDQMHLRCAIIIPKKVVRQAVDRHYLKRVSKEHIRIHQEQWIGKDCIICIKKPINGEILRAHLNTFTYRFLNS